MSETVFTKQEFTRQLFQLIVSGVYEGINSIYQASESLCELHKQPTKALMTFQNLLSAIPKWINEENREKLEKECRRILDKSNCEDYIDELINAVFISYVKSITSVRNTTGPIRVTFEAPTFETFLYRVYVYSAREFWKNPTIFRRGKSSEENQKSISAAQVIIEQAIIDVIRNSIPLKKILKECFNEESESSSSVPSSVPVSNPEPAPIQTFNKEDIKVPEQKVESNPESDIKPVVFTVSNVPNVSNVPTIINDVESDNESTGTSDNVKCINLKDSPKIVPTPVSKVINEEPKKPEPKKLGFLLPDDLESVTSELFNDEDDDGQSAISFEEVTQMKFKTDSEPFEFDIHPDDAVGEISIRK